jgi:hypothetical protein
MTNAKPPFLDIRQTTTTRVSLRQQKSKERGPTVLESFTGKVKDVCARQSWGGKDDSDNALASDCQRSLSSRREPRERRGPHPSSDFRLRDDRGIHAAGRDRRHLYTSRCRPG